jgi:hypothetical protein
LLKEKGVSHIQAFKAVRISSSIYSYKWKSKNNDEVIDKLKRTGGKAPCYCFLAMLEQNQMAGLFMES